MFRPPGGYRNLDADREESESQLPPRSTRAEPVGGPVVTYPQILYHS
jgi:hypothetical protein